MNVLDLPTMFNSGFNSGFKAAGLYPFDFEALKNNILLKKALKAQETENQNEDGTSAAASLPINSTESSLGWIEEKIEQVEAGLVLTFQQCGQGGWTREAKHESLFNFLKLCKQPAPGNLSFFLYFFNSIHKNHSFFYCNHCFKTCYVQRDQ